MANIVVLSRQTLAGIDDEDHDVGLGDRLSGLARHFLVNARLGRRLKPAGVDDDELLTAQSGIAVVAVAGQPRKVGHDGIARLGQAVEQSGLADVGAAHQGQDGFHRAYKTVRPLTRIIAAGKRTRRRRG